MAAIHLSPDTTSYQSGSRTSGTATYRKLTMLDDASKMQVGDYLRDLGTMREIERIDVLKDRLTAGRLTYELHFLPQPGVADYTLTINGEVRGLALWRLVQ